MPCASGGLTWMSATSTGNAAGLAGECGISERNTGMKSARPSCTASRTLAPMKKALCRKRPSHAGRA